MKNIIEEFDSRFVCINCIKEEYLVNEIKKSADKQPCHYCKKKYYAMHFEEISRRVELAIEEHFDRTSDQPDGYEYALLKDKEINYCWERSGEPIGLVISELLECDENIAEDIREFLHEITFDFELAKIGEESPFDEETYYEENDPSDFKFKLAWSFFEKNLKISSRFFSNIAEKTLDSIFENIETPKTKEKNLSLSQLAHIKNLISFFAHESFILVRY
jgi:hypothetical protein